MKKVLILIFVICLSCGNPCVESKDLVIVDKISYYVSGSSLKRDYNMRYIIFDNGYDEEVSEDYFDSVWVGDTIRLISDNNCNWLIEGNE